MRKPNALRPDLGTVCRFVGLRRQPRLVRPAPLEPLHGVLADLADSRGRH